MPAQLKSWLSGAIQLLVSGLLAWLAAHGIGVPASAAGYVDPALLTVIAAGYVALAAWLGGRTGGSFWAQAARFVARVMTGNLGPLDLGLKAKTSIRTGRILTRR